MLILRLRTCLTSAGGCSGEGLLWDLQSNQTRAAAKHGAPIRHIQFLPQQGLLVTGSWDRTLAYWDARTDQPALRVQLPERVYAMHAAASTLVVGMASRHIQVRPSLRTTSQHVLMAVPLPTTMLPAAVL